MTNLISVDRPITSRNGDDLRKSVRFLPALVLAMSAALIVPTSAQAAGADDVPDDSYDGVSITLDDGSVIGPDDAIDFTFEGDKPVDPTGPSPAVCPEVHNKPVYTVKGTPNFIADKSHPQSTWLLPRQSVSWQVSGSHTFTADVTVGAESDLGAIIAKAKLKIDVKIGNSWTWTGSQTVSDTNSTSKSYRAVLGSVGWKLTTVKTWVAAPCTPKKMNEVVLAPRQGDMSIGRSST
jgi:hypothetical protein